MSTNKKRTWLWLQYLYPYLSFCLCCSSFRAPRASIRSITTVEAHSLSPSLFGIGTVEAQYTYKIGPTFAGRVNRLNVNVGDQIKTGQELGRMDPIDLDERIHAQEPH